MYEKGGERILPITQLLLLGNDGIRGIEEGAVLSIGELADQVTQGLSDAFDGGAADDGGILGEIGGDGGDVGGKERAHVSGVGGECLVEGIGVEGKSAVLIHGDADAGEGGILSKGKWNWNRHG